MSSDTRLMCGISLLLVPTIIYGGLTVLGLISGGRYGAPAPPDLTPLQMTLYRAMHAHAGVLTRWPISRLCGCCSISAPSCSR